ncbi:MAG TPA: class F sortase [Candidatus Paceibacterota bacterium]
MKTKIPINWLYSITTLVGFLFFASLIFFVFFNKDAETRMTSVAYDSDYILQTEESNQLPIRMMIPKISVDAPVEYMGLTSDGSMDAPVEPSSVGWFHPGTIPGEIGSAVIDGHSGWKGNEKAVFDNLHKLKKGDKVYVENKKKEITTFIVTKTQTYDPDADTSQVFGSNDGLSHLNIITCAGVWDEIEKSHSNRLVVFTNKDF